MISRILNLRITRSMARLTALAATITQSPCSSP